MSFDWDQFYFVDQLSCDLQVWIDLVPLRDGRNDVQRNEFVAHLAEVLVALVELGVLLRSALGNLKLGALSSHGGLHSHHDVVVLVCLNVCSNGEAECLTTHSGTNHLNREISGALE